MEDHAIEIFISGLKSDLHAAAHRRLHRRHQHLVAAAVAAATAVLAGGAFAAHALWSGTDLTPADIARQATTVTNDSWALCDGTGHCTNQHGTHLQIQILPSMGVSFILPTGQAVNIVPAEPIMPAEPVLPGRVVYGRLEPTTDASGKWTGGTWTVDLPGGGRRTIVWRRADGSIVASDRRDGKTTTTTSLHAGDVVPLIPGSLDPHARTLEKAVTFDLPSGERVSIFPTFNETYVGGVSQPGDPLLERLPAGAAEKYGLVRIGEYNGTLPVTPDGGSWSVRLPDGSERTISWQSGEPQVTISDRSRSGGGKTTDVPIGHELPLIPFHR